MVSQPKARKRQGFACLSAEQRREMGRRGGQAAQKKGTTHKFTSAEARAAGQKGGKVAQARGTAHRFTSEEAKAARRKRRRERPEQSS
jgi:hypothetical protein